MFIYKYFLFIPKSRHFRVDIGGACGDPALCPDHGAGACDSVKTGYHFYMALENDICEDYITEKFWDNLRLPVLLIVQRRAIYEGFFVCIFITKFIIAKLN
jgi:alpha-1,3-fucosyltransferase